MSMTPYIKPLPTLVYECRYYKRKFATHRPNAIEYKELGPLITAAERAIQHAKHWVHANAHEDMTTNEIIEEHERLHTILSFLDVVGFFPLQRPVNPLNPWLDHV